MRKYLLILLLLPLGTLWAQVAPQRCDSTYIELFAKTDYDETHIPCDTFVVMGRGYYDRIALGYNLRGDIIKGQTGVIDNLALQLQIAKDRTDTLQRIVTLTTNTLNGYRSLADGYEANLAKSIALNKTVVDSTRVMLQELRVNHKKEVKRAGTKGFFLGAAVGALVGFIAGVLLVN